MKDLLEGKPFGHPLHPILVHLPIGLFTLSFALDLCAFIWPEASTLVRGSFYCILAGVISSLLAAIPGFVDYTDIREDHPAKKPATLHMILNLVAVGLYAVDLGLRASSLGRSPVPILPFLVSLAALGVLGYSGYVGGTLVYDDGVGVGRHRRKTELPAKTIRISTQGSDLENGFLEIPGADALAEQGTMCFEVNGVAITLVKSDGKCFAVQEFCTHRFGPLSEGCVKSGAVVCPWHGSTFDLNTGAVKSGPAKVSLKTFAVKEREGKVFLKVPEPVPRTEAKPASEKKKAGKLRRILHPTYQS